MGKSGREFREGYRSNHRDQKARANKRAWIDEKPQSADDRQQKPFRKAA